MKMIKTLASITIVTIGTNLMAVSAMADDTSEAIEKLKKQIEELSQKVKDLEEKHDAEEQRQKSAPFITAGGDGFTMQSADTNFLLRLHGFGQFDSHYYASPNPGAKDTFTIRRLRAVISGEVYKHYEFFMQTDFASGTTSTTTNNAFLQDAFVNIHYWDGFQIAAGKMKVPVSLELRPADEYLWFVERGLPFELAPNRDVGIKVTGALFKGALHYSAGVFNGVPDGGSGDVEVADNSKDGVARVLTQPFKNTEIPGLQNLGFGVGSSYGLQAGTTTPSFATIGRQTFFKYLGTVSEKGQHIRVDPQGYYFWGPFGMYGEYILSDEEFQLNAAGKKPTRAYFDNTGWQIDGSYFLTGETNTMYDATMPLRPFRFDGSGWGAWRVMARFGQLSLDPNSLAHYAAAGSAQGATSWSVGLNWFLNSNIKCILEYGQTAFDGGGKALSTASSLGPVSAQNERVLMGRLQFGF
jgi:phosphate-selective porin OprO/OprP